MNPLQIGPLSLTGDLPFFICGPCVIESREHTLMMARAVAEVAAALSVPIVFKASYDKANRTSLASYRGPGIKAGLDILREAKEATGLPVLTDIHEPAEADPAAEVADILQIPAFLCRQTDLIVRAARTGRIVNIKKGQFLAPWDMVHVVEKAREAGAKDVILTERGSSFGYNNLVSDMRSLVELGKLGCPVVYDATHSVQTPGGAGGTSGGRRDYIEPLLRGAVAVGVDGVFIETHNDPDNAKSDGPNSLPLERLPAVIRMVLAIDRCRRDCARNSDHPAGR